MTPQLFLRLFGVVMAIGICFACYLKGRADVQTKWDLARVTADSIAHEAQAKSIEQARATEKKWADQVNELETRHNEKLKALRIANGRLADQLRQHTGNTASANGLSTTPRAPLLPEGTTPGAWVSGDDLQTIRKMAFESELVVAYAQGCREYVLTIPGAK